MDINDKKDLDTWQKRWEELQRRELEESREVAERRTPEFDHAASVDRDLVRAIADNDRDLFAMSFGDADVNARGLDGRTPLFWAVHARTDPHFAEALLGCGADVRARDKDGQTPLHVAASNGNEARLRVLLDRGAEIDARDAAGETPLHCAAIPPRIGQLTFLVSQGADVSIPDNGGRTPLDLVRAARGDHALCKKHPVLGALGDDGWELLRGLLGGFTTVKVVEARPDSLVIRVEDHYGRFPDAVWQARERGSLAVPTRLVFGSDAPGPGQLARCRKDDLWCVLAEVWNDARRTDLGIEKKDVNEEYPHLRQLGRELKREIAVTADRELFQAINDNNLGRVSTWLARGADVNARDWQGQTPIFEAGMEWRDQAVAELLLARGADVRARDQSEWTPLHVAAVYWNEASLGFFLNHGAEIDARDVRGLTPLHYAARYGRLNETTYLVGRGADVSIRDHDGQTPLDHMRTNGIADIQGAARRQSFERLLGGFMTVKVVEARPDSLVVQVETIHSIYPEAEWRATERGTLTVPCGVFHDAPEPGQLVRCEKGLSPGLDEAWSEARRKVELGIERER